MNDRAFTWKLHTLGSMIPHLQDEIELQENQCDQPIHRREHHHTAFAQ
jgi:hypothetical protein